EFDQKRTMFERMTKTKSFNKNAKQKALYHALMESILEDEDAIDKGVADKSNKRKPDDADKDEGPPTGPDQRDLREYISNTDKPHVIKVDLNNWFKKSERPPTLDLEWNEDDFPLLYLNDIKDMLLLVVQNRLFNLKGEDIVHLDVALHTLHDMATTLRMGYKKAMPKRRWSHLDKTLSHIMVKEINRQLQERRLMRILEKFVGGRHYGEDLRLLQRTL
nr:hypothetical protein [Tanacetum cinerariifolium]